MCTCYGPGALLIAFCPRALDLSKQSCNFANGAKLPLTPPTYWTGVRS